MKMKKTYINYTKYVHKLHKIKLDFKIMNELSQKTLADNTVMEKEFEQEYFES